MKTLLLLRHAKSGDGDGHLRDFDRRLNAKGRRAAFAIGTHLAARGLQLDLLLASPALRVRDTLVEVATGLGTALAPRWEPALYLADEATLFDRLRALPADTHHVMLAGHNPGLEQLALRLAAPDGSAAHDALAAKYPTAALADFALDLADWSALADGAARLRAFTRPRDLDPSLGPDGE